MTVFAPDDRQREPAAFRHQSSAKRGDIRFAVEWPVAGDHARAPGFDEFQQITADGPVVRAALRVADPDSQGPELLANT